MMAKTSVNKRTVKKTTSKKQSVQQQINEVNKKLDIILKETELQQRHRREMDDLKDDLMRVGKDVYDTAVLELEEVHDQLKTGDILYLGKKLLRNVNNITKTFEQLEGTKDFLQDIAPISRELFMDLLNKLDEFDRKGYFEFMKQLGKVIDNVVTTFDADDVKHLAENIGVILTTVKNLTQPDMLSAVNNAVSVYKNLEIDVSEKVTMMSLVREMNKPEVRKGLAFALKFLKNLGEQDFSKNAITIKRNTNEQTN
jgi:uncharacterized protein YjgD (DUF1641 family)